MADMGCTIVELVAAAESLTGADAPARKRVLYETWLQQHPADPLRYAALFNLGVLLSQDNLPDRAAAAFAESVALQPSFLPAHVNLGLACERLGQPDRAAHHWLCAADGVPPAGDGVAHATAALKHLSRVLKSTGDVRGAETALRRCLDLDPRQRDALQHWIALRQMQCAWPAAPPSERISHVQLMRAISPLSLAIDRDDPIFQLANAWRHFRLDVAPTPAHGVVGRWPPPEPGGPPRRLRIGYVSPDLREHAVGFLTAELFALHDRNQVEVFAYYSGRVGPDAMQSRIRAAVDHWRTIAAADPRDAARRIIDDGIDILVDLGGHTCDAPGALFALRPAPVIVNWLGFPGSMGTPHHQYIIADAAIIPPELEPFYSERVLRLPCYQPTDRRRLVGTPVTREDVGLPEDAVVYCCLNGTQKITPGMFARWLRILADVPSAVLWLLSCDAATDARLRAHAADAGVSPDRLLFAPRLLNAEHLARFPLADLFLDTFPYGAHTTASDALWMGVPVLTLRGHSFASRVCASLVQAAGLPELVFDDPDAYVARAVALGRDPAQRLALRDRLRSARDRCVLFDTPGLVTRLESLYARMWAEFEAGTVPEPDLRNLELYCELGETADEPVDDWCAFDAYRARYAAVLAYRNAVSPVPPDGRLWR